MIYFFTYINKSLIMCTLIIHLTRNAIFRILFLLLAVSSFIPTATAARASATDRGEALYLDNCAICHGSEGKGGMGIPLALDSFLNSASDDYLRQSIRLGRPGRIMPSFYWMSDSEINDIIRFIASWRSKPAPEWKTTAIKGDINKGKSLFSKHCIACHGKDGGGGKGPGLSFSRPKDLPITAAALNNQGFLNSVTDEMLHYIIKHGRHDTPMPAATVFTLNDRNINDIVSYIRSFQQPIIHSKPIYHDEPASLIVESPYSFDETVNNVKRAIVGSNFVHIRDQPLNFGFNTKSTKGAKQTIVYFCNFNILYESLKIDPRVGMFLPCRITVTETNGKVQMMSINPKHLSQLFNNNELNESCDQMYEVYTGIMEDASL
ncbi:Cytochrome c family protein [hydrothermal vent metagenome]|uniref:Cytochrome c family protein n=1 Tax=hydrothermal vent metagenome TaxID=652676 RepID=A0A3B0XIN0_9ZZZZ